MINEYKYTHFILKIFRTVCEIFAFIANFQKLEKVYTYRNNLKPRGIFWPTSKDLKVKYSSFFNKIKEYIINTNKDKNYK